MNARRGTTVVLAALLQRQLLWLGTLSGQGAAERGLATKALQGPAATPLQYLAPLGWERIDLMGDYVWPSSAKLAR
ncbi:hypothetical protein AZOA_26140 [Azoarcus sp. Aa7]|nr:hypothetical protein [Azoarcus sp. Aa7]